MYEYINQIELSFEKAMVNQSKLTTDVFQVPGMCGEKTRHFLNNLLELPDARYLEIGVHRGGTFTAAMYDNNPKIAVAVDNWSEFSQDGQSEKDFYSNCQKFVQSPCIVLNQDCFQVDLSQFKDQFNIYLYDGNHAEWAQYKALEYYRHVLSDHFVFMVDDWNWEVVQKGTRSAIANLGFKIEYEKILSTGVESDAANWWNGVFVSVLSKG